MLQIQDKNKFHFRILFTVVVELNVLEELITQLQRNSRVHMIRKVSRRGRGGRVEEGRIGEGPY